MNSAFMPYAKAKVRTGLLCYLCTSGVRHPGGLDFLRSLLLNGSFQRLSLRLAQSPNPHVSKVVSQSVRWRPTERGRSVNIPLAHDTGINATFIKHMIRGYDQLCPSVSQNIILHMSSRSNHRVFSTDLGRRCALHACRRRPGDVGGQILTTSEWLSKGKPGPGSGNSST